jgi:hypothetical protein
MKVPIIFEVKIKQNKISLLPVDMISIFSDIAQHFIKPIDYLDFAFLKSRLDSFNNLK